MDVVEDAFIGNKLLPKIIKLSPSYFLKFLYKSLSVRFEKLPVEYQLKVTEMITSFCSKQSEQNNIEDLLKTIISCRIKNETVINMFVEIFTHKNKDIWTFLQNIWSSTANVEHTECVYFNEQIQIHFALFKPVFLDTLKNHSKSKSTGVSLQSIAFMLHIIRSNMSKNYPTEWELVMNGYHPSLLFDEYYSIVRCLTNYILNYKGVANPTFDQLKFLHLCKSMLFGNYENIFF